MRTIRRSSEFKRDYKREARGRRAGELASVLEEILEALAEDRPLDRKYADHPLSGAFKGYRDCHVFPDLVLIYKKQGPDELYLARLGSHSELFD